MDNSSFSPISNSDDDNKMDISFSSSMSTSDHLEIEIDLSSSTINDLKLDNLNIDVYHFYLFKYLHIKDIINLRAVSKIFRSIVDSYEINQLAFIRYDFVNRDCDSDESEYGDGTLDFLASSNKQRCLIENLKFDKIIESPNLLNIKDLSLYIPVCSSKLEYVNKFVKLERLKFEKLCIYLTEEFSLSDDDFKDLSDLSPLDSDASSHTRDDWYEKRFRIRWQKKWDLRKHRLQLPELKELDIYVYSGFPVKWSESCFVLVIDTPNLQKLEIGHMDYSMSHVEIIHPLSIKYLKVCNYYRDVSVLSNLECLEFPIYRVDEIEMLKEVPKLKNLKKLLINYISSKYKQQAIDGLKDLFVSKKDDLDIVLFGVKIKNTNKLNEYEDKKVLKFQLDNFSDLEDDLEFSDLDYIELVNLLPNKLPSDFFKKYSNIKKIKIDRKINDEDRLIFFIKNCKKLYELHIKKASLSQKFYDQLPAISSLVCLKIEDYRINTEFAEKMPHLFSKKFYLYDTEDDLENSDDSDELDDLDDHQVNEN